MEQGRDHEARITALEEWRYKTDVERAGEKVDRKHIDDRFDDIEDKLKDIKSTATWLNRAVWGALVAVLLKYAFSGGFSIPGV